MTESTPRTSRRGVTLLMLGHAAVCGLTFWLAFGLINELQHRSGFESSIELTLRRLTSTIDNADQGTRFYLYIAQEIQDLEDRFEAIPRDEKGEPVRFVQADVEPLVGPAPVPAAEPGSEPQDLTDALGRSLTLRTRPSQADYASAYSRALNRFRQEINFEKIKVDRYASYMERHSYTQKAGYKGWSLLSLAVVTLLSIGAFAGALGGLLHAAAERYLDRPPAPNDYFALAIRPLVSAIVALLTGYTLMYIASGAISFDDEATLFMPVSIYGFAFFMAINPYNSMSAIYSFLKSQTQTFILMGPENQKGRDDDPRTLSTAGE